jgi:hypothetical protein
MVGCFGVSGGRWAYADKYMIHLPANSMLEKTIAWLPSRPMDGPPHEVRRPPFQELLSAIPAFRPSSPARC